MTSAPRSPKTWPQNGPASTREASRTRMSERGVGFTLFPISNAAVRASPANLDCTVSRHEVVLGKSAAMDKFGESAVAFPHRFDYTTAGLQERSTVSCRLVCDARSWF